jgi:hypothetical protein
VMEATRPGARIAGSWRPSRRRSKPGCTGRSLSLPRSSPSQAAQFSGESSGRARRWGSGRRACRSRTPGALASAATCRYQLDALNPAPVSGRPGPRLGAAGRRHPRGRGRGLDVELLARLRHSAKARSYAAMNLARCIVYPRSRLALDARSAAPVMRLSTDMSRLPRLGLLYGTSVSSRDLAVDEGRWAGAEAGRPRGTAAADRGRAGADGRHARTARHRDARVAAETRVPALVQYFGTGRAPAGAMQQLAAQFSDRVLARIQRIKRQEARPARAMLLPPS